MRRLSSLMLAFCVLGIFNLPSAQAQLPVTIKIHRPAKSQPTPSTGAQPTTSTDPQPAAATPPRSGNADAVKPASTAGNSMTSDDQPMIAKDSVQVTAYKVPVYHGNFDTWSWVPQIAYRVNGPIASGSQLYVEFSLPGSGPWVKFDCETGVAVKDHWWKTECGGRDVPEAKGVTYTGPVNFAIKMRNELAGSDTTLFTGKAKVAKIHSNEVGPKAVNRFIYYVDHDWTLPIGYLLLTADTVKGWNYPQFNVVFWMRGEASHVEPHLFYQGKEVGRIIWQGEEVGRPTCGSDSTRENGTMSDVDEAQRIKWERVVCTFPAVKGWDKTGDKPGMFGPMYLLSTNPGDYELKVLWHGHLARSIKFTVRDGGKFDNGIASANKLGSDRVIVPVQILGEQDGQWNHSAWKTEAFYGNPLTGFMPPP